MLVPVVLLVAVTMPAEAQRRGRMAGATPAPRAGAHVGYNLDVEEIVLGAQLGYPITAHVALYPSFDYYLVEGSLWSLNLDLKLRPRPGAGTLYFGGGLNYTSAGDAAGGSRTGLNVLTGLEGARRGTVPYVEAKLLLSDQSGVQLIGGFSFSVR
jgi:hypothetical protein